MNLSDEQPVWIPPRDGNERPRNESRVIVGSVSGLLTLEDSKGIIGHMVPDYDVVELRDAVLQYAQALRRAGDSPDIQEAEELGDICK